MHMIVIYDPFTEQAKNV